MNWQVSFLERHLAQYACHPPPNFPLFIPGSLTLLPMTITLNNPEVSFIST